MSFSIGLYDLFSYLIPGILYIYIINEFLILFHWVSIDIARLNNVIYWAVLLVAAYVLGHMFSAFVHFGWYSRKYAYRGISVNALERLKERTQEIEIRFQPRDWWILLEVLRRRDRTALEETERYKVNSVMMRNINFTMFLYAIYQLTLFFKTGFTVQPALMAGVFILLVFLAFFWGERFDTLYYRTIFTQALSYGPGLKEFLENDKPCWRVPVADAHASQEDQ